MADLDHNLSLADALTEPPPEIEEEVKRDFIATLEAEKFDDVVGETVDKTDYVPLLDDDDAKAGSQEPKSKPHADGIQVEHTSASGPTVVENGDHGIEDHRTVFPGEIMDEKLSYKEFLDRNDSWTMDDRDLCFESQPVFKPMEMADPFSMHRGENLPDLSFPTDMKNVPLFTDHVDASRDIHAPHGPMMVPEQPFLGPLYSPAEALDPSAFIGLDSTAEFLQDRAAPEEHWMGAQHDVKGPDASFFVEPPVPPTVTEAINPNLPESPVAVAPGFVPPAVTASPGEAEATDGPKVVASADAVCVPASDVMSASAEKAGSILAGDTKPPQALDAGFAPTAEASPLQALDVGFAPAPEDKPPNAVNDASTPAADVGFTPAADAMSHYATDLEFAPAEDAGFAPAADVESHHAMDLAFAPAADVESHHAMDLEFAPAAEVNHVHAMDSGFAPVAEAKPLPAMDSGFASAEAKSISAADTKIAASEELMTSESSLEQDKSPFDKAPAEATANVEQESKVPEACVDLLEQAKDSRPPPSHHEEHLPEETNHLSEPAVSVEAKEAVALENKDLLPEKSVTSVDVTVTEKQKEEAEHNHVQHAEPQQEKTLQEPTGLPTAQIRQANKSSERRFGRAKPAPMPITDVPEERLIGLPQQKSTDPKVDPCSVGELGCVAGTSPRTRVSHKKATEQPSSVPSEFVESCRGLPRESWDLEGSLGIVKKKKKKPKQKRNQLPRTMEFWDENVTTVSRAPRNSPFAVELQKPDVSPVMPAEARKKQSVASGSRASDMPKDAKIITGSHILDEQNAFSVPAPGQQAQHPSVPLESVLNAKTEDVMKTEETRDDSLMLQSKGKRKEVPLEQVGKTKVGESVTAKGPTKPTERDFLDKNEKREYKETERADLTASLSEVIDLSKVETPLQTKPSELLLSDKDKEAKCTSPRREAFSDAVHHELQTSKEPKENDGKKEIADMGALDQPFLLEGRREEAKYLAMADTISKTKEVNLITKGKEAGSTSAGESVVVNPDAALVGDKPRKRCSDGKRKKPEKSPLGQAAVLDTGVETSDLASKEKLAGSTKEMTFDKDKVSGFERELLLENLTGVTKLVLEKPDIQGGNRRSFSDQPVLSGHKIETSEPEIVNAKETRPMSKGKELDSSEPLPGHGADAAVAHSPTRELVMDKPKKKSREVKGKKAENSLERSVVLDPGNIPAVGEEVGNIKQTPPFDKGKETDSSTLASLLDALSDTTEVQAPAMTLEPEKSHTGNKETCKKTEANLQQPFLLEPKAGAELLPPPPRDVEKTDKSEAESPTPCSRDGGLPILEHPAVADHTLATVTGRSKERGYDGSSKKVKNVSEQPVFLEPKPNKSEVQPPMGSEMEYGMEDTDFVDENRNIKNFPIGPQMLWNNKGSDFESFVQSAVTGPDTTGNVSSGFPKQTDEDARSQGLPPPEAVAEKSSKEPRSSAKKEIQMQKSCEQPINLGHKEPGKEVSKKDGQPKEPGSQDGSEAGKPLSLDHSVKQDIRSKKDKVHLPVAKVDDKEIRTTDKKHNADDTSSDLPEKVADSKNRAAPVGAKGTEKPEATVSSGEDSGCISPELAAIPESKAEAGASQVVAEALMENKAEEAEPDGGKKSEQSSLKYPSSLDNKATEAEAAGLNLTAAQPTQVSPKANSKGPSQPAEEDAARGGEAHLKDAPALKSEVDKPQDTAKAREAGEQKAVKEAKKERVKAAEQIKGYMRPTKSRGVPALPARSAAPEREKQRQLKPTGMSRQRQEKGVCLRFELAAVIQTACVQDLAICQCVGMNT
ncbi:PREDICTED: microtubule-associated protein 4-like [Cariama cristata]|uniref:microtubule-associated protein 4-like n=1 Tax=Cariama cristata TaxID=54380 RepID=UPI0005209399|nr:PREDICTED: microtubule-associated protein 4-like [Cariama cristata]